jgi:hypothetical protein
MIALRSVAPAEEDRERIEFRAAQIKALVDDLRQKGFYAIARIVVFKDELLALEKPELALTTEDGTAIRERDGIAWTDPRNPAVWAHNIEAAVEAARAGFDEIQFDYVRFPSMPSVQALVPASGARTATISGFLADAKAALRPFNVFVAADVFGYASWDPDDTNVGHRLEDIAAVLDYVCLMLYPSSFKSGLPGARMPLDAAAKIVELSLRRAQQRTGLPSLRFRPWLQAFRDYNFDNREFKQAEIAAQVQAAEAFGSNGWMLWQRSSIYVAEDLPQ